MLPAFLLGILMVIGVVVFLKWYANAKTEEVKRSLRITGLVVGGLIIVVLAVTGRLGAAIAGIMALGAWAMRVFNMIQVGRQFMGMFRGAAASFGGAAAAQESDVRSQFFRMTLEHGTGRMDGEVLVGAFTGRRLTTLSRDELNRLHGECRSDPDSTALFEAFMDRNHPDWRGAAAGGAGTPPTTQAAMSADEARRILGVGDSASEDEIKAAYRRLMGQMHPDKGGSDYLAAKVNQAKDILLKSK